MNFEHVFKTLENETIANNHDLKRFPFEETKRFTSTERCPKSFGTFEKRPQETTIVDQIPERRNQFSLFSDPLWQLHFANPFINFNIRSLSHDARLAYSHLFPVIIKPK